MTAVHMKSDDIAGNALAYWQDVVCDLFVPLSCSAADSHFGWEFVSDGMDDLRMVDMVVTPHRVHHGHHHVAKSTDAFFILSQQVDGTGVVIQDGQEAALYSGDLAIYDSTRPYELHFSGSMRQRIIRIPYRRITEKLPGAARLVARPISGRSPLGRLCSDFITSSFGILGTSRSAGPTVRDTLTDLLCAALREKDGEARLEDALPSRVLHRRIVHFIETHLADPDLGVERIARAMRLSPRYVHMLMRDSGTTPAQLIWSRRLDRCAEALSNPANASVAVSQIAYAWGYKDAAHFTRSFRSRFGIAPGEFRRNGGKAVSPSPALNRGKN